MKKFIFIILFLLLFNNKYIWCFGQNKVDYKNLEWQVLHSTIFDIHFYQGADSLAWQALDIANEAYEEFAKIFNIRFTEKIPIILYKSPNDFQQTNVISDIIEEGTGGFTEYLKNRVVIPYAGTYLETKHVIRHELVHVFQYYYWYRNIGSFLRSAAFVKPIPLWVMEGGAEYFSIGWDESVETWMRDAINSNYIIPLQYLDYIGGVYLLYKEGQAFYYYVEKKYGEETLKNFLQLILVSRDMDTIFKQLFGKNVEEFNEEWINFFRKKFWSELVHTDFVKDIAIPLTKHSVDLSNFNLYPAISKDNSNFVYFSDRHLYTEIIQAKTSNGETIKRIIKGGNSEVFESLHSFSTSISWNPDGNKICFISQTKGSDWIFIYDFKKNKIIDKIELNLDIVRNPSWSPKGDKIAFEGCINGKTDIYILNLSNKKFVNITNSNFSDIEPFWDLKGENLYFSSDRTIINNEIIDRKYNIYKYNLDSNIITEVTSTPYNKSKGKVISINNKELIAYIQNKDKLQNIFVFDPEKNKEYQITNISSSVFSFDWANDNSFILFSALNNGGWDIFKLVDPLNVKLINYTTYIPNLNKTNETLNSIYNNINLKNNYSTEDTLNIIHHNFSKKIIEKNSFIPKFDNKTVFSLADTLKKLKEIEPYIGKYKLKFSPDYISGQFTYMTGYGINGYFNMGISDLLGNHHYDIIADFNEDISKSNIYLAYTYLKKRYDINLSFINWTTFYYSRATSLGENLFEKKYFSEKFLGGTIGISYPFSRFSRVDFLLMAYNLQTKFYEEDSDGYLVHAPHLDEENNLIMPEIGYSFDNTIWAFTGPISGQRSNFYIDLSKYAWKSDKDFISTTLDYRIYFNYKIYYTFAMRFLAQFSEGKDKQNFFLGGYETMKGYSYNEIYGNRLAYYGFEFRFPFIDNLTFRWPLPLYFRYIRGALFIDTGAAWNKGEKLQLFENNVMKDLKYSYGCGTRIWLGSFLLRFDIAWTSNWDYRSKPHYIFSLGADF